MEIVILLLMLAAAVWAVALVRYHDVVTGISIFLVMTCLFPPEFGFVKVAGLSMTLDRAWFLAVLGQFVYDFYTGRTRIRSLQRSDVFLCLFLAWLTFRTITTPIGHEEKDQPNTINHLINGYIVPTMLFLLIRHSKLEPRRIWPAVAIIAAFGIYLSFTAIFEVSKQWSLVYPTFIRDPKLGIHYGRARGPMLQSIRLGVCLCLCLTMIWVYPIWIYAKQRWAWVLAASLTPLYMLAVFLTYTRSIWMGAAAVMGLLLITMLRGKARMMAIASVIVFGSMGALILGPSLTAFKREYSAAETLESTRMRGAFAYVSWLMFKDSPLVGFGFNQFQIQNRPYLDDRTTNIRLESIRGYVHHNSFLSLVIDLGLVGAVLYGIAAFYLIRNAWQVWTHPRSTPIQCSSAVLAFCIVAVHAIQMAFHEVSFSPIENSVLMFSLGIVQVFRDDLYAKPMYAIRAEPDRSIVRNFEPGRGSVVGAS